MCAEKPAGVRDGTEVFALGGFTETLAGIQAGILKVRIRARQPQPRDGYLSLRNSSWPPLGYSEVRFAALFGPHAISDLSPGYARKRTSLIFTCTNRRESRPLVCPRLVASHPPPSLVQGTPVRGVRATQQPVGQITCVFRAPRVQPFLKKYSDFQKSQISRYTRRLVPTRGALRGRHGRWARDAVDVEVPLTNGTDADGEVVWS
jgi:hypothetical protein